MPFWRSKQDPEEQYCRLRLFDLIAEAGKMVVSQPVGSVVTVLIVAAVCAVILATTGQTASAERKVLAHIDAVGSRVIVVTDVQGLGGINPEAVERISMLSATEWAVGFGTAEDAQNAALDSGQELIGQRAAVRVLYGELPGPPVTRVSGRRPQPGEALVGGMAADMLSLKHPAGGVEYSEGSQELAVVGRIEARPPLDFLQNSVLAWPVPGDNRPVKTLYVLARSSSDVAVLTAAVDEVLNPQDRSSVRIETSEELMQVQGAVAGELGRFGRDLLALVLGIGLVLICLNVYGQVTFRRRDFGRRRALGATRNTLIALTVLQTFLAATLGTSIGTSLGMALVWRLTDGLPRSSFVVSVAILALLSALGAASPPAVMAAFRDPIRVLRLP